MVTLKETSDRPLIISPLQLLAFLYSHLTNPEHITPNPPGFETVVLYLSLFGKDKGLTDAVLDFLQGRASVARAFLLHPKIPSASRDLLLSLLKEGVTMVDLCNQPIVAPVVHLTLPIWCWAQRSWRH